MVTRKSVLTSRFITLPPVKRGAAPPGPVMIVQILRRQQRKRECLAMQAANKRYGFGNVAWGCRTSRECNGIVRHWHAGLTRPTHSWPNGSGLNHGRPADAIA